MRVILLIFLYLLLASCGDDGYVVDPARQYEYGTISALKNGETWIANIHGVNNPSEDTYFGISIHIFNPQGFRRESLGLGSIPRLSKTYRITNIDPFAFSQTEVRGVFATLALDGDVFCDGYRVYEPDSLTNILTITAFDENTTEISGTFSVTFLRHIEEKKCDPDAVDTIRFTNGKFYTKITR